MPNKIKVQAKDVSEAIAKGLKELGLRRDQVEVTVLETPKKGFLGIGSRPAVVELRQKRWSTANLDAQIYMDVPKKRPAKSRNGRNNRKEAHGNRRNNRRSERVLDVREPREKAPKANEPQMLPCEAIRNAVIPEGMFMLCGMEDAKLISMVQLNGGILLMPESVSTYQLLMLIDALNEQACEFLEAVAAECGPAEAEHRDMTLDEVLREFTVAVPDWAREKAGITADTKLDCEASEDAGVIAVYPASYRHDLTDVPRSILQCLLTSGHSLYALNDILTAESENSDAE